MTRYIIVTAIAAFAYLHCQAQDFKDVLQKTFTAYDTTQNVQKKIDASNKLTMIAKKYNEEWAPHFYNAYSKAVLSYMEQDEKKRDAYVDDAEKELDEAVGILGKDNDETYVMKALVANARLAVDGRNRWQKYGKIFNENLEKAKEINPDNPRIYYLLGISKFYMPKMFGGGKKAALPYFEKADGLFAKENDADITKPYWGKIQNTWMLAQAKGEDKE
ncbi:MAG: hypothetical protein BGO70_01515 [Bacteroidetes bacterium 43-93]|nr:hypothetical protein [Bacteroidota bacterium]OJW96386.1 MAG: hypothetical protein BGO70_01515 [Bacteroidetes bacterium 43-93]